MVLRWTASPESVVSSEKPDEGLSKPDEKVC